VIALWLGHESVERTQTYVLADVQLKKEAMAKSSPWRPHPDDIAKDQLLAFLEAL
jgi:integrase/recombinase XerD